MTNTLKSHFWRKNVIILSLCTQRCYGRHNVSGKSSGLLILLHGIISLPDATSYDKSYYIRQKITDYSVSTSGFYKAMEGRGREGRGRGYKMLWDLQLYQEYRSHEQVHFMNTHMSSQYI